MFDQEQGQKCGWCNAQDKKITPCDELDEVGRRIVLRTDREACKREICAHYPEMISYCLKIGAERSGLRTLSTAPWSRRVAGMANIPDDEIKRDAQQRQFLKYAKRPAAKARKQPPSKRTDLFRRARRLPGSAYSRKG
jgi:hypothetical protein